MEVTQVLVNWCVGVVILLLMILTAFIGYVLPWGIYWRLCFAQ